MKEVVLSRGKVSIVDDCDYEYVQEIGPWHVCIKAHTGNAYAERRTSPYTLKKKIRIHQVIMESIVGPLQSGFEVDHVNRNSLDNRRENLRLVDRGQNQHNRPGWANKPSGLPKGVHKNSDCKTYYIELQVNKVKIRERGFKTVLEAKARYDELAAKLVGKFHCKGQN